MNYDKWQRTYQPIMDGDSMQDWDPYTLEHRDIITAAIDDNRVWSLMESDGIMWLEKGLQTINRFGVVICQNSCDKEIGTVFLWSREDEKTMIMDRLNGLKKSLTYPELQKLSFTELQELEEKHL